MLSILDLPHDGILGYAPGVAGTHDIDDYPDAAVVPGLVAYRYDAPLFFANAEDLRHRALAAMDDAPTEVEWFLLNAEANVEVDIVFAMARVNTLTAARDPRRPSRRCRPCLRSHGPVSGL